MMQIHSKHTAAPDLLRIVPAPKSGARFWDFQEVAHGEQGEGRGLVRVMEGEVFYGLREM